MRDHTPLGVAWFVFALSAPVVYVRGDFAWQAGWTVVLLFLVAATYDWIYEERRRARGERSPPGPRPPPTIDHRRQRGAGVPVFFTVLTGIALFAFGCFSGATWQLEHGDPQHRTYGVSANTAVRTCAKHGGLWWLEGNYLSPGDTLRFRCFDHDAIVELTKEEQES